MAGVTLDMLLTKEYGVSTHPEVNPITAVVALAATQILGNNPNRLGLSIVNMSANVVYIFTDNSVSANKGYILGPNGGSVAFDWRTDFSLISNEWWAIAVGGVSNVMCVGLVGL